MYIIYRILRYVKSFKKNRTKVLYENGHKKSAPLSRGMSIWKQEDVYGSMKFLNPLATARAIFSIWSFPYSVSSGKHSTITVVVLPVNRCIK